MLNLTDLKYIIDYNIKRSIYCYIFVSSSNTISFY